MVFELLVWAGLGMRLVEPRLICKYIKQISIGMEQFIRIRYLNHGICYNQPGGTTVSKCLVNSLMSWDEFELKALLHINCFSFGV